MAHVLLAVFIKNVLSNEIVLHLVFCNYVSGVLKGVTHLNFSMWYLFNYSLLLFSFFPPLFKLMKCSNNDEIKDTLPRCIQITKASAALQVILIVDILAIDYFGTVGLGTARKTPFISKHLKPCKTVLARPVRDVPVHTLRLY